jgi:hypothetical protein
LDKPISSFWQALSLPLLRVSSLQVLLSLLSWQELLPFSLEHSF